MKKAKKLLALVLMLCIGATILTGCGGNSDSDKVTLRWAITGLGCTDDEIVHKEFNKKLNELMPGVQVEFIELNTSNWSNWMNAGEKIDIAWTGYQFDVESEINNGAYMELDDLISKETTPNIYQEMQDYAEDYYSGTYNDKLYMIPIQQPIYNQSAALTVPIELTEYMDIDALLNAAHKSTKTTREVYDIITDYLEKVWDAEAYDTDVISACIDVITMFKVLAVRGYDFLGADRTGAWLCYDAHAENPEVVSFMETDAYKLFLEYAGKWYKAGYITDDILLTGGGGVRTAPLSANASGMWYGTTNPEYGEERGITYVFDQGEVSAYFLLLDTVEQQFNGTSKLGSEATYSAIPYTSEHPEEAIQLLDLLRSPAGTPGNELANLLVYGFEKNSDYAKEYDVYHYTLDGTFAQGVDYTIQPSSNCQYGKCFWTVTNAFLTYHTSAIQEGQSEWALDFERNTKPTLYKTKLYRFRADFSNNLTDVSDVAAVITQYNEQLISGLQGGNYDSLYKEMINKMKAADLDVLKEVIQKQANEYIAQ